ncbi:MAG: SDR family NAD(P)-dependent oxidoreductase [Pseudomonadota bacterium]
MNSAESGKAVCLITGVGDATGAALARRFAAGGYRVAMIARNADRLERLAEAIPDASAYPGDVADLDALLRTVTNIRLELGEVQVLLHNAVSHTFGTFLEAPPADLERNFRVNTTALLHLARAVAPAMIDARRGAIIATGNTAAHRGVPDYALFAPSKAAQRILCESLARELGPKRVHVGYVTIDAPIDVAWLGRTDAERPSWLLPPEDWPWAREDFFAQPDAIADEVYHMAHQHPSAWSFETTIRPFAESW